MVFFWSARNARDIKKAEPIALVYEQFRRFGVAVVGIAPAANSTQLLQVCRDSEFVFPQILDSGGIANRYHVDLSKPYLVLDQSRKVIAAVASPFELQPVLESLTKYRKERQ